jgi:beta-fructofuranosidase
MTPRKWMAGGDNFSRTTKDQAHRPEESAGLPGGEALLYYDAPQRQLVFDSTRSGGGGRKTVERAPFALEPGESLKLRVFVGQWVVEVYASDRQAIGRRVFPVCTGGPGLALFATGGRAQSQSLHAWEMMLANPF